MDSYELKLYNDKHDYIALYVDITTSEEIKELLDWARFVTANSTAWTKGLLNPRHWDEVQGTEFKGVEQYCPQWPKQDFYVECDEEHFDSASFRWTDFYLNNGEELATGDCSDCGNPWASTKTKDVTIRVVKMPDVFGSGGEL